MENDIITVTTNDGKEEQVELILTVSKGKKKYLLYKDTKEKIYASYMIGNDDKLHNDLTEEEYKMLEDLYIKGTKLND